MQAFLDELMEIGHVYAHSINLSDDDDEILDILEDIQLNILTELYDELIRELEEELSDFIEEDILHELLDELINLTLDEIHIEEEMEDEAMNIDEPENIILPDYEEDEFSEFGNIIIITKIIPNYEYYDESDDDDESSSDEDDDEDDDDESSDSESSDQDWVYDDLVNNLIDINVFKKIYFGEPDSDDDDSDESDSSDGMENILAMNWEVPSTACTCAMPFHSDADANNVQPEFGDYLDSDEEA